MNIGVYFNSSYILCITRMTRNYSSHWNIVIDRRLISVPTCGKYFWLHHTTLSLSLELQKEHDKSFMCILSLARIFKNKTKIRLWLFWLLEFDCWKIKPKSDFNCIFFYLFKAQYHIIQYHIIPLNTIVMWCST